MTALLLVLLAQSGPTSLGSIMKPVGVTVSGRPTPSAFITGGLLWDLDGGQMIYTNGTEWLPLGGESSGSAYDGGIVAEAYSADASVFAVEATVAHVAFSTDASFQATQLASNPTDCGGGQFANAIDRFGNLTCATPPGASGASNYAETQTTLTDPGFYQTLVTGQAWVTPTSKVVCGVFGSDDAGLTVEAIGVAGLNVSVSNLVEASGFTVNVASPYGLSGIISIHCIGGS